MEFWRRIEAFFDILFTRNVMTEIASVTLCLWVGWFVGATLRSRYQRRGITTPTALTWKYLASQGIVVVAPVVVALLLVIFAHGALFAAHFDVTIMDAATRLIGAYVAVRVGIFLFAASLGSKSWMQDWEGRIAVIIWLAIAAEYLGWLDPIIAALDSVGIAAGKSRITVWSVLKLLFILTLFMLVAIVDQPLVRPPHQET